MLVEGRQADGRASLGRNLAFERVRRTTDGLIARSLLGCYGLRTLVYLGRPAQGTTP